MVAEVISSFVSNGPKFYAYIVCIPEGYKHKICKIKDIIFNNKNSLILNFNNIKKLIIENEREKRETKEMEGSTINLHFTAIRRTAFHEIVTRNETKSCTPVLVKRRFIIVILFQLHR